LKKVEEREKNTTVTPTLKASTIQGAPKKVTR